jgi:hypothetical protein
MPAIVPGWEASLCRCHRRRRRKRASRCRPFSFCSAPSSRSRRASRRRRAPERRVAGPLGHVLPAPAREPPTRVRHYNRLDALSTARAHARPPPGRSRARAVRRRRPEPCRGEQVPFRATQGGKGPSFRLLRAVGTVSTASRALDFDGGRRRRLSPRRHPHRRRRSLPCCAATHPWPRRRTGMG